MKTPSRARPAFDFALFACAGSLKNLAKKRSPASVGPLCYYPLGSKQHVGEKLCKFKPCLNGGITLDRVTES